MRIFQKASILAVVVWCSVIIPSAAVPQTAEQFYEQGKQDLEKRGTELARFEMTQALILDPNGSTGRAAYNYLRFYLPRYPTSADSRKMYQHAVELERSKAFDAAIKAYKECIQKHPFFEWAYTGLGYCYWHKNEFDEAEHYCLEALKINPASLLPRANLGWCKLSKGDYATAEKCFKEVLTLDPSHQIARDGLETLKDNVAKRSK